MTQRDGAISPAAGRVVAHVPTRFGIEDRLLVHAVPGATYLAVADGALLSAVCLGTADAGFIEGRLSQWLLLNRPSACADRAENCSARTTKTKTTKQHFLI